MTTGKGKTVVKRVKPYPFTALMDAPDGKKASLEIQKLTLNGFLATLSDQIVIVGRQYAVSLNLPVFNVTIMGPVKAWKTYDIVKDKKEGGPGVVRMAEFHFISLTSTDKSAITRFLLTIGQD